MDVHCRQLQNTVIEFNVNFTDNVAECVKLWRKVKQILLSAAFEETDAIAVVYNFDDEKSYLESSEYKIIEDIIKNGTRYLILSTDKWKIKDLEDLALDMEFELGQLWFTDRRGGDMIDDVIKLIDECVLSEGYPSTKLEMLGCVADGKSVIWLNPKSVPFEKAVMMLENMSGVNLKKEK